ncbi:MAG: gfo/Idh/MocA family oxidoreductase, partial [Bacteroidetes bacterium]|nr:gfo/Idh/MocA family oxidoreductase [Bacteroidota bacterium]
MKQQRRKFIRDAALASAGFFIVPRNVLGRGFVAPSDQLLIAGIGAGGKGASDLSEFSKSGKVGIVAFADVDEAQAAGSIKRFPSARFYT